MLEIDEYNQLADILGDVVGFHLWQIATPSSTPNHTPNPTPQSTQPPSNRPPQGPFDLFCSHAFVKNPFFACLVQFSPDM